MTGFLRRLDNLGRIVIPREIRRELDFHEGEEVCINRVNNEVIISKFKSFTCSCGNRNYTNYNFCPICGRIINKEGN